MNEMATQLDELYTHGCNSRTVRRPTGGSRVRTRPGWPSRTVSCRPSTGRHGRCAPGPGRRKRGGPRGGVPGASSTGPRRQGRTGRRTSNGRAWPGPLVRPSRPHHGREAGGALAARLRPAVRRRVHPPEQQPPRFTTHPTGTRSLYGWRAAPGTIKWYPIGTMKWYLRGVTGTLPTGRASQD